MIKWGKEPFDLRLTVLRFLRCLPVLLAVTLAGTLLGGGFYYVKNIVLRPEKTWSAQATYYVEYADENWAVDGTYINYMTWNTWITSQEFTGFLQKYLENTMEGAALSEMLEASVPSDHRVPVIKVTSRDAAEAERVLEAVNQALVQDFPEGVVEVSAIRVTDVQPAKEDLLDVRPVRAFVLAAVLSAFFTVVIFLLRETLLENIWLPVTLSRRYGLKQPGILGTAMAQENLKYFFAGKKRVAVCPVSENMDPGGIVEELKQQNCWEEEQELTGLPCPALAPEAAEQLRRADGVLLVVPAGEKDAKQLEAVLDFLGQQDVVVTAAILWEPDMFLVKNYYRFQKQ